MSPSDTYEAEHGITVRAPAQIVFDLIADIGNWPLIFPPTVHVEYVERGEREERIRIWATANGEPKGWTSRRELDRNRLQVRFRQEVSQPPVARMGGLWRLEPLSDNETRVRLTHDFQVIDDDPDKVSWVQRALDENSDAELTALKQAAEHRRERQEQTFSFSDSLQVAGTAKDVYDFIDQAGRWEERLPHVARVVLTEETPNIQTLEMDTRGDDGGVHTTKSVRICFPTEKIVYKQLRTPALMTAHTGEWRVHEADGRTTVTSTHTVRINPEAIPDILGSTATIVDAQKLARTALGRNSKTTMELAKKHAERAVRT